MKIKIAEAPKQVIDFLVAKCEGAVSDDIDYQNATKELKEWKRNKPRCTTN